MAIGFGGASQDGEVEIAEDLLVGGVGIGVVVLGGEDEGLDGVEGAIGDLEWGEELVGEVGALLFVVFGFGVVDDVVEPDGKG